MDIGTQARERVFDNEFDADGGSQVEDPVRSGNHTVNGIPIQNGSLDKAEVGVVQHAAQVLQGAGGEIIKDRHLVAGGQEVFRKMAADKAGAACNCCFHGDVFPTKKW